MAAQGVSAEVGVSAREAEVLAALADHLTNAEIAARLFISIRTVESHVSSLLRKLQVTDRRALAAVAATVHATAPAEHDAATVRLPSPLTSFVGRVAERAELTAALDRHRLVTALGPGGIGKTRLALSVAADLADRYADCVWFVDLVAVTDPAMIAPALADALGLGERQGRSAEDTVLSWLGPREALLVLDNCEHLLDGLVVLLERLLVGSPRLTVLATSRARLLVPFEWVFPVPGLSLGAADGDAVALFLGRAAAAGSVVAAADRQRVADLCAGLDGMALAIELAAARMPSVGLDGLEAGLADRLHLLTGSRRIDDRHRSLRSTLDWSYALLHPPAQAVLRRIAVFAGPFTADAAAVLNAGWPPVAADAVPTLLAGLADQSLLVPTVGPGGTRYRALETIRQYGVELLTDAGEATEARGRHLAWCLDAVAALDPSGGPAWRLAFDQVAGELRTALGWAATEPAFRAQAHRLAVGLGDLCFARGLPGEAQLRYERAAALAADDRSAADGWHLAAGAAKSRHFGNEALRLHREASTAYVRAGDRAAAARELLVSAELINRATGTMAVMPPDGEVMALVAEARSLAPDDEDTEVRAMIAEALFGQAGDSSTTERAELSIALAGRVADPLLLSAALDDLTSTQLARGEVRAATASAIHRMELLDPLPVSALSGFELADAYCMAAECAIAAGDLPAGRRMAERVRDLPFYREEGHLATARLLVVTALAGDWDETVAFADRFREGWERAGCPRTGNLSRGAYAAATVYGLRGDFRARQDWLAVVDGLATPNRTLAEIHFGEFFDALLLLHRGRSDAALEVLRTPPEEFRAWHNGMWRPWYAAVWAEAAVLARRPDAAERIGRARLMTADNPIAATMVERAATLAGDRTALPAVATALSAAACRYQWARTLVLSGGAERAQGEAVLAAMGATPMVVSG